MFMGLEWAGNFVGVPVYHLKHVGSRYIPYLLLGIRNLHATLNTAPWLRSCWDVPSFPGVSTRSSMVLCSVSIVSQQCHGEKRQ